MKDQTPEGESKESEPKGIAIIRPENSFFYNTKTPIHRRVYPLFESVSFCIVRTHNIYVRKGSNEQ